MTADRTQHVLDAIDGALDDWTVSDDAMRWSPEPVKPWRLPGLRCDIRPVFTDAGLIASPPDVQAVASTFRYMTCSYADAFDRFAEAIGQMGRAVAAYHHEPENGTLQQAVEAAVGAYHEPDQPEPPDRTDVRAHALWRAQHRNTGPQRPTAGQSKRPRR